MDAGQLKRSAVELAKQWRLDKYLRRLDASPNIQILLALIIVNQFLDKAACAGSAFLSRRLMHLRCLQAVMIVADAKESLTITGNGDVVEPHDGVIGA